MTVTNVALTGASGFIGQHILGRLAGDGFKVRALVHRSAPSAMQGAHIIQGSLNDEDSLAALVKDAEVVIHCAGIVAARKDSDFHAVNAIGTEKIAAAAARHGVARFLLISSLAARHPHLSPYANSKAEAERRLSQVKGLKWDIIRPPAVYGPGDRQILTLLKMLSKGLAILPAGKTAQASLIHAGDLAGAVRNWVAADRADGEIYELDDGFPGGHNWQDILSLVSQLMGTKPVFICPPRMLLTALGLAAKGAGQFGRSAPFLTPGKVNELCHPQWVGRGNAEFSARTGWQPEIALNSGMKNTLDWYYERKLL